MAYRSPALFGYHALREGGVSSFTFNPAEPTSGNPLVDSPLCLFHRHIDGFSGPNKELRISVGSLTHDSFNYSNPMRRRFLYYYDQFIDSKPAAGYSDFPYHTLSHLL